MSEDTVLLTSGVKKIIFIVLAIFFTVKLSLITGWELKDYKRVIQGNYSENLIHLDTINVDKQNYFNILRKELVEHVKNGTSVDLTVEKIHRELSKPYLLSNNTARQEVLILTSSVLLATKNYALNHSITEEQLKSIQTLFKTYMSLNVEFSGGLLKRKGMLFVPDRDEVSDFLSPAFTLDQLKIEKQLKEENLKNFKKL